MIPNNKKQYFKLEMTMKNYVSIVWVKTLNQIIVVKGAADPYEQGLLLTTNALYWELSIDTWPSEHPYEHNPYSKCKETD